MYRILGKSSLLSIFLIVSRITSLYSSSPLIFDPYSWNICDAENPPDFYRCAAACSAQERNEQHFNKVSSLYHNALFMKMYSKSVEKVDRVGCDKTFKLSVVYRSIETAKLLDFGYEVYYIESEFPQKFKTSDYTKFSSVTIAEVKSTSGLLRFFGSRSKKTHGYNLTLPRNLGTTYEKANAGPTYDNLRFIWLSMLAVNYRHSSWSVQMLVYEINASTNQLIAECGINILDNILHEKNMSNGRYTQTMEKLYSSENQKEILKDLVLPKTLGSDCRMNYACIKKYNITPYNFHSYTAQKVSCSELTSVPIWYELNESLLDYLDNFLISIAQVSKGKFKIHVGVLDTITIPSTDKSEERVIYLNPNEKKLPIPKIIYKIVLYKTYNCDTQEYICQFGVVIVIHNHPVSPENRIFQGCTADKCEEWGWESIQYGSSTRTGRKSRYIYCCQIQGSTAVNLKYKIEDASEIQELKLNHFPYFDGKVGRHRYENRQEEFENKTYELFESWRDTKTRDFNAKLDKDELKV